MRLFDQGNDVISHEGNTPVEFKTLFDGANYLDLKALCVSSIGRGNPTPQTISRVESQIPPLALMRISLEQLYAQHQLHTIKRHDHTTMESHVKHGMREESARLSTVGKRLFSEGDYRVAIGPFKVSFLMMLKACDPNNREEAFMIASSAYNVGSTYLRLGKHEEATLFLSQALDIRTTYEDAESIVKITEKLEQIRSAQHSGAARPQ